MVKSQELLCLVNSVDLVQQIIKLGMLTLYPSFSRQQDMLVKSNQSVSEQIQNIRKYLKQVSSSRAKKAQQLVEEYHQQSEDRLREELNVFTAATQTNKKEVLVELEDPKALNPLIEKMNSIPVAQNQKNDMEVDNDSTAQI